ncbi:MAG: diacylglycerol/lipid kinase family protein [Polyangiaceae bacterium]
MNPLVIVNPNSGGGKTGRVFSSMQRTFESALGTVDVTFTERTGHAIEIAAGAAKAGRDLVVAVGGDGTLNEVINGLMRAAEEGSRAPEVAIVGQGTGGDFRKTLGLEHRLDKYLEAIASGRVRAIDVGRITYRDHEKQQQTRFFVNILSAGMGGLVDRYVAGASRALGGKVAYFGASLRALVQAKRGRLRCEVTENGKTSEKKIQTLMIAICNGRYFGSGMHVAPMAKIDDGKFEVVSIDAESKLAFSMSSQRIYDGTHIGKEGVVHFSCEKIDMDLENEDARELFLLDCDGEPIGGLPISVEVIPGALRFRG